VGVWRKWIFPILRIVVFAVIAAALVKLAFFADTSGSDGPAVPTGTISDPVYVVTSGTVRNEVKLTGTIEADPSKPVKAVAAGTVDELFVGQGATVNQGDELYDIKVETPRDPVETTGPDGSVQMTQPKPIVTFEKVLAPSSGVLTSLTVIHGQVVAIGDTTGQVSPPSFSVVGSIQPAQQYRLTERPTEASVSITGGPAPFTCTGLTISAGTPSSGGGGSGDTGATSGSGTSSGATGGPVVRCAVPSDITVFAGLAADLTISAGSAENVPVIPTTAVQGGADTGKVYLIGADGAQEERAVELGLSDGTDVQVVEGLVEGDQILQFTPNAAAVIPEGCYDAGGGAVFCDPGSGVVQ
jgi:multidrug efflux pump subunit AcrA (membrane-fusion protein)